VQQGIAHRLPSLAEEPGNRLKIPGVNQVLLPPRLHAGLLVVIHPRCRQILEDSAVARGDPGFDNVSVATARLMRALGMKIHAINPRGASDEPTDWIATADLLDEMLRVADVLVISAAPVPLADPQGMTKRPHEVVKFNDLDGEFVVR
jgi:hypothetical protein